LNGAGMGKWEFGTTGLTLDNQPPQDLGVNDANLKLEDSPTLNIPFKARVAQAGDSGEAADGCDERGVVADGGDQV
jgi:hypothetical protein